MSLREKIIVALAALAVLYGAYELGLKSLFSGDAPPALEKQDNADSGTGTAAFTANLLKKVNSVELTPRESHILENTQSAWDKDPFIDAEMAMAVRATEAAASKGKNDTTVDQGKFTYSGFIALGPVKLAVINGMEYEEGDTLKETEYVVQTIRPSKVILFNGHRHLTVHLEEIEAKVK
ncbi:MAG: hypothetical protein SWH61_02790 [Thermodesulfobacteriota bacterium]|nr:hypothetical protein [Thermodesulfobacteriota bacterium]